MENDTKYTQTCVTESDHQKWNTRVIYLSQQGWRVIPETYRVTILPQGDIIFSAFFEREERNKESE